MSVLQIKDLSFSYNNQEVLQNINLHVEKKDFLAIIGPNGGGKTTLLKLILGINKIQKGTINILGNSSNISSIGYVPQNTNININFPIKVKEVVMMGNIGEKQKLLGYSKKEQSIANKALLEVGMEKFADTKIGNLSGGQRQRVLIARALCSNPQILLLDEPTSSIDVKGQKEIYSLLKKLHKNITVIVVSHDISVILEYATKVAYINKNLVLHNLGQSKKEFETHDGHFCEVELLNMLSNHHKKGCSC